MEENEEKRIVVGVDGSEASIRALSWAAEQAELKGAVVEAIIVWDYPPYFGTAGWVAPVEAFPKDLAEQVLAETIAKAVGAEPRVDVRTKALYGSPAKALVDASADADQLVVGSRGHGALTGALLGSVSLACAHHAHCPVTIIHREPDN